jgi:hypothetical protein
METHMNNSNGGSEAGDRADRSARKMLLAGAGIMGTLLVLQTLAGAPPLGGGGSAHAGMVGQVSQHTILAADASNEDLVLVLDGRNEEVFVYRTDMNKGMQLFQRLSLPQVFIDAKGRANGR